MSKLVACEWYRLRRSTVLLIVAIVMCVLGIVLADPAILSDQPSIPGMPLDVQGVFMAEAADSGFAFLLFGNITAAFLVGTQFVERTIGQEIAIGAGRPMVFGSKCFTCLLVPVVLTLLALGAGIARNAFVIPAVQPDVMVYFARSILLLIPVYAALASPVALIVAIFRDTARSSAATVVFMLMLLWSFSMLMHYAPIVPDTVYTNDPGVLLMLHPVFLVRWVLRPDLGVAQMAFAVIVSIGWTAAFLSASWLILRKCEMK